MCDVGVCHPDRAQASECQIAQSQTIDRLASLSVAEVGHHDAWQLATIGVAIVAPDSAHLDNLINRVRRYVEEQVDVEMLVFAVSYPEEL